jgi:hypothetical protein
MGKPPCFVGSSTPRFFTDMEIFILSPTFRVLDVHVQTKTHLHSLPEQCNIVVALQTKKYWIIGGIKVFLHNELVIWNKQIFYILKVLWATKMLRSKTFKTLHSRVFLYFYNDYFVIFSFRMICEVGSGMVCYWRCFFLPLYPFLPSKFKKVIRDFNVIL